MLIEGIAPGGVGFGEVDGERIYVRHALPGDRVEVGKPRRERGRTWAHLVRVISRAREVRDAPCDVFGRCGGCAWMDIPYADQLQLKGAMVEEAFRSVGLTPSIEPVLASPEEFRYRNRVDFAFANGEDGPVIGLHERGDPRDRSHNLPPVCPVTDCWLTCRATNDLRRQFQDLLKGSRLRAYNPVTRSGVLRSLEIRTNTAGSVLQLTVANDKHVDAEALRSRLETDGRVKGLGIKVSRSRSRHATPKRQTMLLGSDTQTIDILGANISFTRSVFSQVNAFQLEHLYRLALELARPSENDEVLDLYCGVGALSTLLAKRSKHLTGIELDADAVADADENAKRNGCDNAAFVAADATAVAAWGSPIQRFDLVTVNPPRGGLDRGVADGIGATRAERVVYVSCNPETLARDCKHLAAQHYTISTVRPVDMFPQTTHVESVVLLERGGRG